VKLKIHLNGKWHVLADMPLNQKQKNRLEALGEQNVAYLVMNHKLGIMDINEALDKLFDLSEEES
jgi:hypothetical protein